jgi:hypothetical protein
MKIAWLAIGIVLGGCALVRPTPAARTVSESFFIDVPQHGVALTHSGKMMLTAGPPGIPLFEEKAIRNGLALIMKVRNADGEVIGFASELEVFPAKANMLEEDVVWDTDWTLVIPGRGTLFLHQQEHSGELGPKVIGPTLKTGKPWVGDWQVTSTVGPGPDGKGVIAGGSGEFEGARGWFVESIRLERFEKKGVMTGTVELAIHRQTPS